MTDSAKRIANLTPEQRERLHRELEAHRRESQPRPIDPQPREAGLAPLSFAQLRLWLLDQLHPETSAYNLHGTVRLQGRLNVPALERSLNEIGQRHEALRTAFEMVEGQPMQRIAAALPRTLPRVDLRALPHERQNDEARRLIDDDALYPFDLAQGALLRTTLLQLDGEEYLLLLTIHHIISDSWSIGVFVRELMALYEAFSAGRPSPLPPLPIQYADFAIWQRQWLEGEGGLDAQLAYWKAHLAEAPATLELPTDYARPAVQDFRGAQLLRRLSLPLSERLRSLSKQENVTVFMTLLAAFQLLLARCTGQEAVAVGSPIANRNRHEIEGLIGFFVNTLVLHTRLDGNPGFRTLLGRVREVCLGAYARQDMPFEKLVEALQPERDLGHNPLFDVMLDFPNTPKSTLALPGLTLTFEQPTEIDSKFYLTLYVFEVDGAYELHWLYQRALFSAERMASMLSQFEYLLEQIVAAPDTPLQAFSLVTPDDARRLPDPTLPLAAPHAGSVPGLFAGWADKQPGHPAICQAGRVCTYQDLAQNAQTLARRLLAQGLRRGEVVAVLGPRSAGVITSMLGVLWSGGVLLTLEPTLPEKRQRLMLEQAGARRVILIEPADAQATRWVHDLPSLSLLRVQAESGAAVEPGGPGGADAPALPELAPDDHAYLFFTSGTTGVPRGVLGSHRGLSHFLVWQRDTFAVGPQDRCAQLTHLSFDVVLRDILTPLTSGATLYLPDDVDDLGPDRILPWLERERITMLHTVPTLAQAWLAGVPRGVSLRALRRIFFAGEPLTHTLVQRWRETFPEAGQIINLYGPTETTLAKFYFIVPTPPLPGIQPLGWPLPHTQGLVLNESGQRCGVGEPGQIVIRTPYRSLGYANAPEETARRFVASPFRDDENDLLYYTGDRGRYRLDGSLEFAGRIDHQVKIRGVRVEPDEVTALLVQHPTVEACVVTAWQDASGQNELAAYVVPARDGDFNLDALKWHLGLQLPPALVPSTFIVLEQLPRTPNGKVDRRALPPPDGARRAADQALVAPRNIVEEVLVGLWAEMLDVDQVSVHDNFFELRGHSLLATQLIAQLRDLFQVKIRLRSFYNVPTVAGLAGLMLEDAGDRERVEAIAEALLRVAQLSDGDVDRMLTELDTAP